MNTEKKQTCIFFDASLISVSRMDGLNRYSTAILKRIHKNNMVFIANRQVIEHFALPRSIEVPVRFSEPGFLNNLYRLIWRSVVLPVYLLLYGADLYYSPVHEGQTFPVTRQVITIHDFLPFLFPQAYPRLRYFFQAFFPVWINRSTRIICVSRSTQRDLAERFPKAPPVSVIYEGVDYSASKDTGKTAPDAIAAVRERYKLDRPYILMVAEHRLYKNTTGGIRGFHAFSDPGYLLVLVGKVNRLSKEMLDLPSELGIADRVVMTGFISDEELKALYQGAAAFMLPSLYEGFGLPLLEAMEEGCVSLVSNVSSLPEVGGDAAEYFDPLDPQDIARCLSKVVSFSPEQADQIKARMKAQAAKFSYDDAVRQIEEVLHEAAR